jgi:hypothetical protein
VRRVSASLLALGLGRVWPRRASETLPQAPRWDAEAVPATLPLTYQDARARDSLTRKSASPTLSSPHCPSLTTRRALETGRSSGDADAGTAVMEWLNSTRDPGLGLGFRFKALGALQRLGEAGAGRHAPVHLHHRLHHRVPGVY